MRKYRGRKRGYDKRPVQPETIHTEDVDIVNATPLLDIKPYVNGGADFRNRRCCTHDRPGRDY
ncbi:MAG: TrmO family methyltransferase [Bacillota bacterium]